MTVKLGPPPVPELAFGSPDLSFVTDTLGVRVAASELTLGSPDLES